MAELKNTFSWSFSAAGDFDKCPRKRYWSKYGMWNGWSREASPVQKAAYRLNKMDSTSTLRGQVAEDCIMWMLREKQQGKVHTPEEVYEKKAKAMLRKAWDESRSENWRTAPKKYCCLHEHYYPQFTSKTDKELMVDIADAVKSCLVNFEKQVLPRLEHVKPSDEIDVATVAVGDPESFMLEGVKIYAIPDYVYRQGDECHIHDWKAGKPRKSHAEQLAVYGLWAQEKHGIPVEQLRIHLEYLMQGETHDLTLAPSDLEAIKARISESIGDMRSYLVGGDLEKNQAMPVDVWDLAATSSLCRYCNFYELCEEELKEAMID